MYVRGALARAFLLALTLTSVFASAEPPSTLPQAMFRDMVIANHFDAESANKKTIGIEVEAAIADVPALLASLQKELGGTIDASQKVGTQTLYFLRGSQLGDLRVEPNNLRFTLDRLQSRTPQGGWFTNPLVRRGADMVDKVTGSHEIVTPPLSYEQVKRFGQVLDKISAEQHFGGTTLLRPISLQSNIGIDHTDTEHIKSMLANYYRNKNAIRDDIKPNAARLGYIGDIDKEFMAKLEDPNWHPTRQELFEFYRDHSPPKLSRIQLWNALLSNEEIFKQVAQPQFWKDFPKRPVAEFREANAYFSDEKSPNRFSKHLMHEVDFAVAFVDASKKTDRVTFEQELKSFGERIAVPPRGPPANASTLRSTLHPDYYKALKTKPVAGAEVLFMSPDVMHKWGITGPEAEVKKKLVDRYAIQVDTTESPVGTVTDHPDAPYATAHDDGFGGHGDGRALVVDERGGFVLSAKGIGLTPYVLDPRAVTMGWHIGGVDGKASYAEGLRTYVMGEIHTRLGIPSERLAFLIDNKGEASSHGSAPEPSAIIVREIPGTGIRNAHLRLWGPEQIRRGLEKLKDVASHETGMKLSDTSYLILDAKRSAEVAARMQDAYVVNGTLSAGNTLAYPGLIDLNMTEFVQVPDPEYTTLGLPFRFGKQAGRLRNLVQERQKIFARTNTNILRLDTSKVFDEAFDQELTLLALERLGMERKTAEKVFKTSPEIAKNYSKALWEAQMGHLQTDFRVLQGMLPKAYGAVKENPTAAAKSLLAEANDTTRRSGATRRAWLQNLANWWYKRHRTLPEKDASKLLELSAKVFEVGHAVATSEAGHAVTMQQFLDDLSVRAERRASVQLPSKAEIEGFIGEVIADKKKGITTPDLQARARRLVERTEEPVLEKSLETAEAAGRIRRPVERPGLVETHARRFTGDLISGDRMLADIHKLAGEEKIDGTHKLSNRYSEENKVMVRRFIRDQLTEAGLEHYIETFPTKDPAKRARNLVSEIAGSGGGKDVIEIVVHYDGANPIAPGADDNASGVSAGIEIARALAKFNPKTKIRFVFTDREEHGMDGSANHVEQLKARGENLVGAFVLDMIGHHPKGTRPLVDLTVGMNPQNKAIANAVMAQAQSYAGRTLKFQPLTVNGNPYTADHAPYWASNLPALFVRENYESFQHDLHTPRDIASVVNPTYLRDLVGLVTESVAKLSGITDVPEEMRPEMMRLLPSYEAAHQPVAPDRNLVREARPVLGMFTRLFNINWKPMVQALSSRAQHEASRERRKAFNEDLDRLRGLREAAERLPENTPEFRAAAEAFRAELNHLTRKWDIDRKENPVTLPKPNAVKKVHCSDVFKAFDEVGTARWGSKTASGLK